MSPDRFPEVTATDSGFSVTVAGAPGETVTVTALKPEAGGDWLIVATNVLVPKSGTTTIVIS